MIQVAVAVIVDEQQRVLITQRPLHVPHGGFWEFPGGKLESNETAEQALIREVEEEIGLKVLSFSFLGDVVHQYTDRQVQLLIFSVSQFEGSPICQEGQLAMQWASQEELTEKKFPEANQVIIEMIRHCKFGSD